MDKILKIFRVKNLQQLTIVFIVFGITGSMSVVLAKPILLFFFSETIQNNNFYWLFRVIIIFPIYQVLLIIVGTIFGEFKYFWEMERKILIRLGIIKSSRS
ncbi:MAG: diacylglyceryl transferase [Rickettsiales bacterium]|nr:diacylglyceryl transferase [Rickettsiales bacterium]|tara:strand:- start:643 stop:945 length:303 start_codon:yes stop_codon:yes gene_type:complete